VAGGVGERLHVALLRRLPALASLHEAERFGGVLGLCGTPGRILHCVFSVAPAGKVAAMTILDVGRCLGSGEAPREGSEATTESRTSGVCVACSGRFDVEDGRLIAHAAAAENEREMVIEQPDPAG
jgi:hypothetical protein